MLGQFIYYYPISAMKTQIEPIYEEAIQKIFQTPIKIDVIADQPTWNDKLNLWGHEQTSTIELFIHNKDILDKNIRINEGDFFVYGDRTYEILSANTINNTIFGQVEYRIGIKIIGKIARQGQIDLNTFKQLLIDAGIEYINNSVNKIWQQQRGLPENIEGATGDKRELRERLGQDMAEIALGEGPRTINIDSADSDLEQTPHSASSFDNNSPSLLSNESDIYNE